MANLNTGRQKQNFSQDQFVTFDRHSIIGSPIQFSHYNKFETDTVKVNKKAEDNESLKLNGSGTVLLVDDEEINRILGQDLLEAIGYKVLLAENGKDSVEKFIEKHSEIDLVLMDMRMPVMNGSEAFIRMKQIDENCKVIIVSGHADKEMIHELFELGLFGFIRKPYTISDVSQILHRAMENE